MLQIGCTDIGVLGCDFVARGKKLHKLECAMLEHMRDAHPQLVAALSFEEQRELERRIIVGARVPEAKGASCQFRRKGLGWP
jgi:predicted small metal-binding protein